VRKIWIAISVLLFGGVLRAGDQKPPLAKGQISLTCETPERISNIKRIPLEVKLNSAEIDIGRAVVNPSNPPEHGKSYLEIFAEEVSRSGRTAVPVKLYRTGQGRDLDVSYIRFEVETPIEEAERKQKISKHLDDLVREGEAKKADPKLLKLYEDPKSRGALIGTFDRIYIQNRVGTFDIGCHYFPNQAGSVATPVQSAKSKVTIEFKADFLDQPNFH